MKEETKHQLLEYWPMVSIINYKGCLVEKVIGGYKIFGRVVSTHEEVDKIIDEAHEWLCKSIKQ